MSPPRAQHTPSALRTRGALVVPPQFADPAAGGDATRGIDLLGPGNGGGPSWTTRISRGTGTRSGSDRASGTDRSAMRSGGSSSGARHRACTVRDSLGTRGPEYSAPSTCWRNLTSHDVWSATGIAASRGRCIGNAGRTPRVLCAEGNSWAAVRPFGNHSRWCGRGGMGGQNELTNRLLTDSPS